MKTLQIEANAVVRAPAGKVYGILADFREHHGNITPKAYFGPTEVEQGGYGAGTVIRFNMNVLGRTLACRSIITEPEPGRVLMETETNSGTVTKFIVQPVGDGTSNVSILSDYQIHAAPIGWIERVLLKRVIPPIYREELRLLDDYARR